MIRWVGLGRCSVAALGAAAILLGCGGEKADSPPLFVPPEPVVETPPVAPPPAAPVETPPPVTDPVVPPVEEIPDEPETPEQPAAGSPCTLPPGVSGTPENISEAIAILNALPRPTTLACFLEALARPLTLYMTGSDDSLQPAPETRSPRTFILRGVMEMSIVLDGTASNTLEFGFRTLPTRSIKAEIEFPVTGVVSETSLFDRVQVTERTTRCGICHVAEDHEEFPGFPLGVFASDVLSPFAFEEVTVDTMKEEAASCDAAAEPYRCGLLSALFDHGDVIQGTFPEPE